MSHRVTSSRPRGLGPAWLPQAVRMRDQGKSIEAIGSVVCRTDQAIRQVFVRYNLVPPVHQFRMDHPAPAPKPGKRKPCLVSTMKKINLYKVVYTTRKCLKCGRNFKSEGAHNRLCGHCNLQNSTSRELDRTVHRSNHMVNRGINNT